MPTKGAGNAREYDVLRLLLIVVITLISYFLFVCLCLSLVLHLKIRLLGQSVIWRSLIQPCSKGDHALGLNRDDNRYWVEDTKDSSTAELHLKLNHCQRFMRKHRSCRVKFSSSFSLCCVIAWCIPGKGWLRTSSSFLLVVPLWVLSHPQQRTLGHAFHVRWLSYESHLLLSSGYPFSSLALWELSWLITPRSPFPWHTSLPLHLMPVLPFSWHRCHTYRHFSAVCRPYVGHLNTVPDEGEKEVD